MKHSSVRVRIVLLLAFAPQVFACQAVLAQASELPPGTKARVVLLDRGAEPLEGSVVLTSDDGFEIDVRGESRIRRVDFAEIESLQRSLRVGTHWMRGAVAGGVVSGVTGFIFGYCFQLFDSGCARDIRTGTAAGLAAGAGGALVGAGIGSLIGRYSPWEPVTGIEGTDGSGDRGRLGVEVMPYPDGRVGVGVTLAF